MSPGRRSAIGPCVASAGASASGHEGSIVTRAPDASMRWAISGGAKRTFSGTTTAPARSAPK